jgi:isopentenyl-diphosphate delta-isomerase
MSTAKEVILVNEADEVVGAMEKMEAHRKGALHRAFSVFIFNSKGEMLLQQRAHNKYHSAALWTNACCSHPAPGESTQIAAESRLQEEMGFTTLLQKVFEFTYRTEFENGLTEYEFDHVYAGTWDGIVAPQKDEVNDYCFKSMDEIQSTLLSHPQKYTSWFHIAFPKIEQWAKENLLFKSPVFS